MAGKVCLLSSICSALSKLLLLQHFTCATTLLWVSHSSSISLTCCIMTLLQCYTEIFQCSDNVEGIKPQRSNSCPKCHIPGQSLTSQTMLPQGAWLMDRPLVSVAREITIWPFRTFAWLLTLSALFLGKVRRKCWRKDHPWCWLTKMQLFLLWCLSLNSFSGLGTADMLLIYLFEHVISQNIEPFGAYNQP